MYGGLFLFDLGMTPLLLQIFKNSRICRFLWSTCLVVFLSQSISGHWCKLMGTSVVVWMVRYRWSISICNLSLSACIVFQPVFCAYGYTRQGPSIDLYGMKFFPQNKKYWWLWCCFHLIAALYTISHTLGPMADPDSGVSSSPTGASHVKRASIWWLSTKFLG